MSSNSNNRSATTQILGFILILFLILFLYKYYTTNYAYSYTDNQNLSASKPDISTVRCPPKNTLILPTKQNKMDDDLDDKSILMHENDLNIVDNKFNLYDNNIIDNHGFENELGNNTDIDKSLSVELDNVFAETSLNNSNNDDKYANSCLHSKPQKSDLPLANVPYFLLQEDKPLRLSEKLV
jgi:hypothetical protein